MILVRSESVGRKQRHRATRANHREEDEEFLLRFSHYGLLGPLTQETIDPLLSLSYLHALVSDHIELWKANYV